MVTILATGSEVSIAIDARKVLEKDGITAAVISLPSFDLFVKQNSAYRSKILGEGEETTVAIPRR